MSRARRPSARSMRISEAAAGLLFVTRTKRVGLTLEQIAEVLPIWDGVDSAGARRSLGVVDVRQAEVPGADARARSVAELARVHHYPSIQLVGRAGGLTIARW